MRSKFLRYRKEQRLKDAGSQSLLNEVKVSTGYGYRFTTHNLSQSLLNEVKVSTLIQWAYKRGLEGVRRNPF